MIQTRNKADRDLQFILLEIGELMCFISRPNKVLELSTGAPQQQEPAHAITLRR